MSLEDRRQALQRLTPDDYGIYEADVSQFIKYIEDMESVRSLGGLHVIGSERHEARRIDNQLRGRSARQGDPGSSRFYLSMEDDLMRLFGGQQADGLMQRMKIDDALPLEMGLVSRIVEQSQTRVEGANFDVRKHLLEYDDVLNTQRGKIYAQRNRIFTKEDLSEDVTEMLRAEVNRRVPEALKDPDGPWKLLAWLEQIQPPLQFGDQFFPSYLLRLLLEDLLQGNQDGLATRDATRALLMIAEKAIQAESEHYLHSVHTLLEQSREHLESQLNERQDAVDTFFEGLSVADETDERSPRQIADELSTVARYSLRLSPEQQRLLLEDPQEVRSLVIDQLNAYLSAQAVARLVGSIERRLEETLGIDPSQLLADDWDTLSDTVLNAIQAVYQQRSERLLGETGQIARDLETSLGHMDGRLGNNALLQLLMLIPQGARAAFDKKTHRRVVQRTMRFTYVHYAGKLLEGHDPDQITEDVLNHLERAQAAIQAAWGVNEWNRIAASTIPELDSTTQRGLQAVLDEGTFQRANQEPLHTLSPEEIKVAINELGRQALTEVYRQLLLGVITELWVDYLTQMEALRVSIGLEAYAQRDPLVQYKSRAFGLFQDLLNNMRSGLVMRMFTYRPRDLSSVQTTVTRIEEPAAEPVIPEREALGGNGSNSLQDPERGEPAGKNKKRRRRRH
jgi:preprotein translocase subunit SecA